MTSTSFEILENKRIRIGSQLLDMHLSSPPLDGKWKYIIEATSDTRDKIVQHLNMHQLGDIYPTDLPNGISISISSPKTEFRAIQFADIKKLDDQSELRVTMIFDFVDWHLPVNLQHFGENYRDAMLVEVKEALLAEITTTEFGLFITCGVRVPPKTNYLDAYRKINTQVLTTYRKCIADTYKSKDIKVINSRPLQKSDSTGLKWWVRYVLVPVIGSGAFAAVIAGLITFFK